MTREFKRHTFRGVRECVSWEASLRGKTCTKCRWNYHTSWTLDRIKKGKEKVSEALAFTPVHFLATDAM